MQLLRASKQSRQLSEVFKDTPSVLKNERTRLQPTDRTGCPLALQLPLSVCGRIGQRSCFSLNERKRSSCTAAFNCTVHKSQLPCTKLKSQMVRKLQISTAVHKTQILNACTHKSQISTGCTQISTGAQNSNLECLYTNLKSQVGHKS